MHRRVHGPPDFTMLTRVYQYGSDPSVSPPVVPPVMRNTVSQGVIHFDGNLQIQPGRFTTDPAGPPPFGPATGQITVANNNFAARAIIFLGDYKLISHIDYTPGVNVNATATVIAAAITNLPGFTGTAVGADVQIEYDAGPSDQITLDVRHYGTVTNFTPVDPAEGLMAIGWPRIGPPLLT